MFEPPKENRPCGSIFGKTFVSDAAANTVRRGAFVLEPPASATAARTEAETATIAATAAKSVRSLMPPPSRTST